MLVNGIDIRKYRAKQLTVDIQLPQTTFDTTWDKKQLLPIDFGSTENFCNLKIVIYFRGNDRNQLRRNISEFISLFTGSVSELELDGYQGVFVCYITKSNIEKMIVKNRNKLSLEFNCYLKDKQVVCEFDNEKVCMIYSKGTRKSPCKIILNPLDNISSCTISGLGELITITNLQKDKIVIIDGIKKVASKQGSTMMKDIELWGFPYIVPGENKMILSSDKCNVSVVYEPMWL